jgi:hypothetical protein
VQQFPNVAYHGFAQDNPRGTVNRQIWVFQTANKPRVIIAKRGGQGNASIVGQHRSSNARPAACRQLQLLCWAAHSDTCLAGYQIVSRRLRRLQVEAQQSKQLCWKANQGTTITLAAAAVATIQSKLKALEGPARSQPHQLLQSHPKQAAATATVQCRLMCQISTWRQRPPLPPHRARPHPVGSRALSTSSLAATGAVSLPAAVVKEAMA